MLTEFVEANNYRYIQRQNGTGQPGAISREVAENDRFAMIVMKSPGMTREQHQNCLLFLSMMSLSEPVREKIDTKIDQINMELSQTRGIQEEETMKVR